MVSADVYERSFRVGHAAIANGDHQVARPLRESGRWGVSFLLRPDSATAERLAALGREAAVLVGPHR